MKARIRPSDEKIIEECNKADSMAQACAMLEMNRNTFKKWAIKLGCYNPNQGGKGTKKPNAKLQIPLEDILDGKHPQYNSGNLKKRLVKDKIKEDKCEICGLTEWQGKDISLQLDHINGNSHDHRLENLRMLCPNCHSQTDTWCRKIPKNVREKRILVEQKTKEKARNQRRKKNEKKYGSPKDYHKAVRKQWEESQQKYKEMILDSNINFSQFGWVKKVSELTGINQHKVNKWMKRIMPDFYEEKCFKRSAT